MKALIDLHCHTISSGHAYSTIKENAMEAKEKGLKVLGISDHAPSMPGTAHFYHFLNLGVLNEIEGVKILKGIEANIIDYNGTIDVPKEILEKLDYIIASLHPPCISFGNKEENTRAIIGAMKKEKVKIIGHPDDSRYPLNYEEIVKAAKENNVFLELNNSSLNPKGFREGAIENAKTMLKLCEKYNAKIIFGSDAHVYYDVGNFTRCINIVEEMNFPKDLIVNFNKEDIDFLGAKI
ncbi:phosphatase [Clostridium tarantellae]|uniref:PHP domain-containing protein n=1 Tax=Clostridium tarantellae TaxID=39493 RepID=A0A6I1MPC0_9CLOT|nr:PHP domain-containing protein [Clostridium tarantellae]